MDDASADGVEIDVESDGAECVAVLDEDAFESFHPECAATLVLTVEPAGEAFFEFFDEDGEVAESFVEGLEDEIGVVVLLVLAEAKEFTLEGLDVGW